MNRVVKAAFETEMEKISAPKITQFFNPGALKEVPDAALPALRRMLESEVPAARKALGWKRFLPWSAEFRAMRGRAADYKAGVKVFKGEEKARRQALLADIRTGDADTRAAAIARLQEWNAKAPKGPKVAPAEAEVQVEQALAGRDANKTGWWARKSPGQKALLGLGGVGAVGGGLYTYNRYQNSQNPQYAGY